MFGLFVVAIICISAHSSKAQHEHKRLASNLILEGHAYYGFLIPHHIEMEIFNSHFPAFEISITKLTHGRTRWEYMYNYPFVGIGYWYSDIGRSPYLGSAHAIFPYINFPLTRKKDIQLYFRTGLGIGYMTKRFHRLDNYKNVVIGSHINVAISLLLELKKRIGEQFILSAGIGFNHFSNGSMKTPNYGINIPSISAGIAYRLSKENPYFKQKLLPELRPFEFDGKKSVDLDVTAAFGYKDMRSEIGGRYVIFTTFANLLKPTTFKSKYGIGLDISYDGTDEQLILKEYHDTIDNKIKLVQTGLNLAYELNISKVSFIANLGIYLTSKYKGDGIIYEKLALQYKISDHLFTSITLKAHAGRADFIVLGIGYKFNLIYY